MNNTVKTVKLSSIIKNKKDIHREYFSIPLTIVLLYIPEQQIHYLVSMFGLTQLPDHNHRHGSQVGEVRHTPYKPLKRRGCSEHTE
jgi:hypothetical protein